MHFQKLFYRLIRKLCHKVIVERKKKKLILIWDNSPVTDESDGDWGRGKDIVVG